MNDQILRGASMVTTRQQQPSMWNEPTYQGLLTKTQLI